MPLTPLLGESPDATVFVHGATGVSGLLAVQVAKVLGAARVIAAGRSETGLAKALGRGADALVLLDEPLAPQVQQAAPDGVDIVIDYLWGERTAALLPALLAGDRAPDRRLDLVEVGSVAGQTLAMHASWLRSRPLRLSGSGLGSVGLKAMLGAVGGVLEAAADGRLTVDYVAQPLAEVEEAWPTGDRLVLVP